MKVKTDKGGNLIVPDGYYKIPKNEKIKGGELRPSTSDYKDPDCCWNVTGTVPGGDQISMDDPAFFFIRKCEKFIEVDGIKIPLTAEQISFLKSEQEKTFKQGDIIVGKSALHVETNALVIFKALSNGRFDDGVSNTYCYRKPTETEIKAFKTMFPE